MAVNAAEIAVNYVVRAIDHGSKVVVAGQKSVQNAVDRTDLKLRESSVAAGRRAATMERVTHREVLAQQRAAAATTASFARTEKGASQLAGGLRTLGAVAGGAAVVGFYELTRGIRASWDEFKQGQATMAQTRAAIQSTGGVANVTAKQVDQLSNSLLQISGIDDEVIQGGAQMLLTFRNIRNEAGKNNDIFTQATKTLVDMQVAMAHSGDTGDNLKSSAIRLGKALNDPIAGLTSLRRVGVAFTDQQKEQIKTLVEHGHTVAAQKIILHELSLEFGGSAKAMGDTFGGQISKVRENLRNMGGDIIAAVIPAIRPLVARFAEWVSHLQKSGELTRKTHEAIDFLRDSFIKIKPHVVAAWDAVQKMWHALKRVVDAIGGWDNAFKIVLGLVLFNKVMRLADGFVTLGSRIRGIGKGAGIAQGNLILMAALASAAIQHKLWPKIDSTVARLTGNNGIAHAAVQVGRTLSKAFLNPAGYILDLIRLIDRLRQKISSLNPAGGVTPNLSQKKEMNKYSREHGQTPPYPAAGYRGGGFIPGPYIAADIVPAMLSPGEFVATGPGMQQAVAAGMAHPQLWEWMAANQPAHFAKGGYVGGTAFGGPNDPGTGSHGYKGDDLRKHPWSFAELSKGHHTWDALGGLPYLARLLVTNPKSHLSAVLSKRDVGQGGGPIPGVGARAIDLWYKAASALKFSGWGPLAIQRTNAHEGMTNASVAAAATKDAPDRTSRWTTYGMAKNPLLSRAAAFRSGYEHGLDPVQEWQSILPDLIKGIGVVRSQHEKTIPGAKGAPALKASGGALGRMVAAANMIAAKKYPYALGGGHGASMAPGMDIRGTGKFGYDCSGAVSKVLTAGGFGGMPQASGYFVGWGQEGAGKAVTTYARPGSGVAGHVYMLLNGRAFGTSTNNPGGGAGWFSGGARAGFKARHPAGFRRGGWAGFRTGGYPSGAVGAAAQNIAGLSAPRPATMFGRIGQTGNTPAVYAAVAAALRALDRMLAHATLARVVSYQHRLVQQINRLEHSGRHTPEIEREIRRLQAALRLVDQAAGRIVGEMVAKANAFGTLAEQAATTAGLNARMAAAAAAMQGVSPETAAVQGSLAAGVSLQGQHVLQLQQLHSLQAALKAAQRAHAPKDILAGIKERIDAAMGALAETNAQIAENEVAYVEAVNAQVDAHNQRVLGLAQAQLQLAQTSGGDVAGAFQNVTAALQQVLTTVTGRLDTLLNDSIPDALQAGAILDATTNVVNAQNDLAQSTQAVKDRLADLASGFASFMQNLSSFTGNPVYGLEGARSNLQSMFPNLPASIRERILLETTGRTTGTFDPNAFANWMHGPGAGYMAAWMRDYSTGAGGTFDVSRLFGAGADLYGLLNPAVDAPTGSGGDGYDSTPAGPSADDMANAAIAAVERVLSLRNIGLQGLELTQRLAGRYETTAGRQERASFMHDTIEPAIAAEIAVIQEQMRRVGLSADETQNLELQLAQKQNDLLQAQLDETTLIKENTAETNKLFEKYGGTIGFEFNGQQYTDDTAGW